MIQPALASLLNIAPATATRMACSDAASDFGGTLAALLIPATATPDVTLPSPVAGTAFLQQTAATGKTLPDRAASVAPPAVTIGSLGAQFTAPPLPPLAVVLVPVPAPAPAPVLAVIAPVVGTAPSMMPNAAGSMPASPAPATSPLVSGLLPEEPIVVPGSDDGAPAARPSPPPRPTPPSSPLIGQPMLPRRTVRLGMPGENRPDVSAESNDADDPADAESPAVTIAQDFNPTILPLPTTVPLQVTLVDHEPTPGADPAAVPGRAIAMSAAGTSVALPPTLPEPGPCSLPSPSANTRVPDVQVAAALPPTVQHAAEATQSLPTGRQSPGLMGIGVGFQDGAPRTSPAPELPPRWSAQDNAPTMTVVAQQAQPQGQSPQPPPGTVASAAQVFGAAIEAASRGRDEPADHTQMVGPGSLAAPTATPGVAPVAQTDQQSPLDMRHERWPSAMIERIEVLRDAANATDTRIRLIPDALGTIDLAVRKDGDTLHVHFTAEQLATRTLLQDAQPRLAELAEARGLKLSQTAVDPAPATGTNLGMGMGQQQHRAANLQHQSQHPQQQQQQQQTSPTPARRLRGDGPTDTDSTDTRLA